MRCISNIFNIQVEYIQRMDMKICLTPSNLSVCYNYLVQLFYDIKFIVTSSLLFAQPCNAAKPVFLKMDWSTKGMAWILMQPDNSTSSINATEHSLELGVINLM